MESRYASDLPEAAINCSMTADGRPGALTPALLGTMMTVAAMAAPRMKSAMMSIQSSLTMMDFLVSSRCHLSVTAVESAACTRQERHEETKRRGRQKQDVSTRLEGRPGVCDLVQAAHRVQRRNPRRGRHDGRSCNDICRVNDSARNLRCELAPVMVQVDEGCVGHGHGTRRGEVRPRRHKIAQKRHRLTSRRETRCSDCKRAVQVEGDEARPLEVCVVVLRHGRVLSRTDRSGASKFAFRGQRLMDVG